MITEHDEIPERNWFAYYGFPDADAILAQVVADIDRMNRTEDHRRMIRREKRKGRRL